jgi:hypothetical protein
VSEDPSPLKKVLGIDDAGRILSPSLVATTSRALLKEHKKEF